MKFGLHLERNADPEWRVFYIRYNLLKRLIRIVEQAHVQSPSAYGDSRQLSLTVPPPTNAAGQPIAPAAHVQSQKNKKQGKMGTGAGGGGDADSDDELGDAAVEELEEQLQEVLEEQGGKGVTQETFLQVLEEDLQTVEKFTAEKLAELRSALADISSQCGISDLQQATLGEADDRDTLADMDDETVEEVWARVDGIGRQFLRLEKFVNLNFTGVHKILKKHDRRLPNPCKPFYIARLHNMNWVRGDYSDIIVQMSTIYSTLRGDEAPEEQETEKQDFVRSTTKYWVRTEDVSQVKYIVLQHLPVFLQATMGGQTDSQLVNSVYLDNTQLELYHGRLNKWQNAIAIRFRWYGTGVPETVFVERKTHRDGWTGEVSVKERFIIREDQVADLLNGTFDKAGEIARMRERGKDEQAIRDWDELVTEVIQAINSKQLVPTMRTQYMRTAFQIPFDATVRVSLDTNLCMISERNEDVTRWYRDPRKEIPRTEITRFPHAVLEVKLQLEDESDTPEWVSNLIDSGMLLEVHKFSKFIHGCATLMQDDIQSAPYWIDDKSLAASIERSGGGALLRDGALGANKVFDHLLPHDDQGNPRTKALRERRRFQRYEAVRTKHAEEYPQSALASARNSEITTTMTDVEAGTGGATRLDTTAVLAAGAEKPDEAQAKTSIGQFRQERKEKAEREMEVEYLIEQDLGGEPGNERTNAEVFCGCFEWARDIGGYRMSAQKVEPKLLFAAERTLIHWLHMAVTLSSISVAVLAFSKSDGLAQIYAVILLPVALAFCGYALSVFVWRTERIRNRIPARWDDPFGPVFIATCLVMALLCNFVIKIYSLWTRPKELV